MGTLIVSGRARRGIRSVLLVAMLASASLVTTPVPVSAGITGCFLTAQKPGGSGTKAFGRFTFGCIVAPVPFQYQVALWEQDAGPDTRLSVTGWLDATTPSSGPYAGKGPSVQCQTESGKEELYTKVRARFGTETTPWEKSSLMTSRTCQ